MLTSSDAKWRCMWLLLVWSINLTLVSQFLLIENHVAFYIIAAISILVIPVLTAVYSNTSGRHGAGLLRAGLVFCDPVLACITVTPNLLFNQLPSIVDEYACLRLNPTWNATVECVLNHTHIKDKGGYMGHNPNNELERQALIDDKRYRFLIIEGAMVTPILLAFMMCKRTRKMNYTTFLCSCAYWLLMAIEAIDLLETIVLEDSHEHIIYTTEAMICITMIITTSYAIITLLSYISPVAGEDNKIFKEKFDFLYKAFVGTAAVCFCEIPLIVARCRTMAADVQHILPGTFYVWLIKDVIFVFLIIIMIYVQKYGKDYLKLPCKSYDSHSDFHFEPEKRDRYIYQHKKVSYSSVPQKDNFFSIGSSDNKTNKDVTKQKSQTSKSQKPLLTSIVIAPKDAKAKEKTSPVKSSAGKKGREKSSPAFKPSNLSTSSNRTKKTSSSIPETVLPMQEFSTRKKPVGGWSSDSEDSDASFERNRSVARRASSEETAAKDVILSVEDEGREKESCKDRKVLKDGQAMEGKVENSQCNTPDESDPVEDEIKSKDKDNDVHKSPDKQSNNHHPSHSSAGKPKPPSFSEKGDAVNENVRRKGSSPKSSKPKSSSPKSSSSKSSSPKSSPEGSPNCDSAKEKRVTFKFDIGQGKSIELKSRSDSPGVIVHNPDKEET